MRESAKDEAGAAQFAFLTKTEGGEGAGDTTKGRKSVFFFLEGRLVLLNSVLSFFFLSLL